MWVRVDDDVIDHPKTHRLAQLLGTDRAAALGLMVGIWGYAYRYHKNGDLTRVVLSSLHQKLGFTSAGVTPSVTHGHNLSLQPIHEDVRTLLLEARFADQLPDGRIVLHDWDEYNGPEAEKRRSARDRKQLQRERERLASGDSGSQVVTKTSQKKRDRNVTMSLRNDTVRSTPLPPQNQQDARASSDAIPRVRDLSKRLRESGVKP